VNNIVGFYRLIKLILKFDDNKKHLQRVTILSINPLYPSKSINFKFIQSIQDYIVNHQWVFSLNLQLDFPNLLSSIQTATIPFNEVEDKRIWMPNDKGVLTLKTTYSFKA
jgi:hypothetical protein